MGVVSYKNFFHLTEELNCFEGKKKSTESICLTFNHVYIYYLKNFVKADQHFVESYLKADYVHLCCVPSALAEETQFKDLSSGRPQHPFVQAPVELPIQ